ncbi:hypothetical protein U1Q18_006840, partial [Sarracenia purpurea var. burkii]
IYGPCISDTWLVSLIRGTNLNPNPKSLGGEETKGERASGERTSNSGQSLQDFRHVKRTARTGEHASSKTRSRRPATKVTVCRQRHEVGDHGGGTGRGYRANSEIEIDESLNSTGSLIRNRDLPSISASASAEKKPKARGLPARELQTPASPFRIFSTSSEWRGSVNMRHRRPGRGDRRQR